MGNSNNAADYHAIDHHTVFRGGRCREAVLFGVAAGAAAVMTPGTELCRREDAERLYEVMFSDR